MPRRFTKKTTAIRSDLADHPKHPPSLGGIFAGPSSSEVPRIRMARAVFRQIMCSIGARPPETGGILLGPLGCGTDISEFYFDARASCTGATYEPDHLTIKSKLRDQWIPRGIDMKGAVHSHPGGFDQLSGGDLAYIGRWLAKNPDDRLFVAPIVIPEQFRLRMIVVLREEPQRPRIANISFY